MGERESSKFIPKHSHQNCEDQTTIKQVCARKIFTEHLSVTKWLILNLVAQTKAGTSAFLGPRRYAVAVLRITAPRVIMSFEQAEPVATELFVI